MAKKFKIAILLIGGILWSHGEIAADKRLSFCATLLAGYGLWEFMPRIKARWASFLEEWKKQNEKFLRTKHQTKLDEMELGSASIVEGEAQALQPREELMRTIDHLDSLAIMVGDEDGVNATIDGALKGIDRNDENALDENAFRKTISILRDALSKRCGPIQLQKLGDHTVTSSPCSCCNSLYHIDVVPDIWRSKADTLVNGDQVKCAFSIRLKPGATRWLALTIAHEMTHRARIHGMAVKNMTEWQERYTKIHEMEAYYTSLYLLRDEKYIEEQIIEHVLYAWYSEDVWDIHRDPDPCYPSYAHLIQLSLHYWIRFIAARDNCSLEDACTRVAEKYVALLDSKPEQCSGQKAALLALTPSNSMPSLRDLLMSVLA